MHVNVAPCSFHQIEMSLDVYVMPIWRFKSGDVETAVERLLGRQSKRISLISERIVAQARGYLGQKRARREVRNLVKEAEAQLNVALRWEDEGGVVFSEQAHWGYEALRVYAKWLDLQDRFPTFDAPPRDNFYNHPVNCWNDESRDFRFAHIIDHSCHGGYYVPCRFERVVYIEPHLIFGKFKVFNSLGSSYTLRDQLITLKPLLPNGSVKISPPTRERIQLGFESLERLSNKSLEYQLPIIFWG